MPCEAGLAWSVKPSPSGSVQSGNAKPCCPWVTSKLVFWQTGGALTTSTENATFVLPPSLSATTTVQSSWPLASALGK